MEVKKLYVIVEFNEDTKEYLSHAVDGLAFESEKTAEEYKNIKPDNNHMDVKELILYKEEWHNEQ